MEILTFITQAIDTLIWPISALFIAYMFKDTINNRLLGGAGLSFEIFGNKFELKPSKGGDVRDANTSNEALKPTGSRLMPITPYQPLPPDYLFLTHISFFRSDKQDEFKKTTGVYAVDHYDIRVALDSYYKGALERVSYVEYFLHEAYPDPIQVGADRIDHFMLKEVANGEYLLLARVWLTCSHSPLLLKRHISLGDMKEVDWKKWLGKMGVKPHKKRM